MCIYIYSCMYIHMYTLFLLTRLTDSLHISCTYSYTCIFTYTFVLWETVSQVFMKRLSSRPQRVHKSKSRERHSKISHSLMSPHTLVDVSHSLMCIRRHQRVKYTETSTSDTPYALMCIRRHQRVKYTETSTSDTVIFHSLMSPWDSSLTYGDIGCAYGDIIVSVCTNEWDYIFSLESHSFVHTETMMSPYAQPMSPYVRLVDDINEYSLMSPYAQTSETRVRLS